MATTVKDARQLATMAAKEERARDAALAMQEYEAEKLAICAKTASEPTFNGWPGNLWQSRF